jgi:hypothetical protein
LKLWVDDYDRRRSDAGAGREHNIGGPLTKVPTPVRLGEAYKAVLYNAEGKATTIGPGEWQKSKRKGAEAPL